MTSEFRLRVPGSLAQRIRTMHPQLKKKIRAGLDDILANPYRGKALKLELDGLRSYRTGRFRIIYRIGGDRIIELVAVGPRKTIYEETYRMLR